MSVSEELQMRNKFLNESQREQDSLFNTEQQKLKPDLSRVFHLRQEN